MVTYDINDKYCPEGHSWLFLPSSLLFGDCYYCKSCDKIYRPSIEEVSKEWFKEHFVSDRFNQIKELSEVLEARKKVSTEDLIKLGYLKK